MSLDKNTLAFLKQAKLEKRLFFYSWSPSKQDHNAIEVCIDCDAVLIDEKLRDQIDEAIRE